MKGIKIGVSAFTWIASLVGVVVVALIMMNWESAYDDMDALYVLSNVPSISAPLGVGVNETYFLLLLAVVAWAVFWVVGFVLKPKAAIKSLISMVGIIVIMLFSVYVLGDSSFDPNWVNESERADYTDSFVKWISGGLMMTVVLAAIAVLALIYLEVNKIFK